MKNELSLAPGQIILHSPTACPLADSFLWNQKMMAQINCRGFMRVQYLSPEPQQYSQGPVNEATTFMMPEQSYYQHHPGRFFYLLDEETGAFFSAPYEPVRAAPSSFQFIAEDNSVNWVIVWQDIEISIKLQLADNRVCELWQVSLKNLSGRPRRLLFVPCFSLGYQSWMNQQATVNIEQKVIAVSSIHPWQLMKDYESSKAMSKTVRFKSMQAVDGYCVSQSAFEGEGGLAKPDAIFSSWPDSHRLNYQIPIAAVKHHLVIKQNSCHTYCYEFGTDEPLRGASSTKPALVFTPGQQWRANQLHIESPCREFDLFVNHWLPRQLQFLCEQNRFCTDPQTRNFLQDQMGSIYFEPDKARQAFLFALAQQQRSGAMPDGILLNKNASLKYINQVPHADHCVWLFYFIECWLNETGDLSLLSEVIDYADDSASQSVCQHLELAAEWLHGILDERDLCRMAQGDWCDPMNMVGHKGKGVSIWLTQATCWALKIWSEVLAKIGQSSKAEHWRQVTLRLETSINRSGWDGQWYARAINDDGRIIGNPSEQEGCIFLNAQSFAVLSGVASSEQIGLLQQAVKRKLFPQLDDARVEAPIKVPMMLAPAFREMDEGIGRVTQKSPGTAENGSVYNHAAIFYALALFQSGQPDDAWQIMRDMVPRVDNYQQLTQLPNYIPNYYRGYVEGFEQEFARSSRLFNTGTIAWYYRCLVEALCGLKGCEEGLLIAPNLPTQWSELKVCRRFRGATFNVTYHQIGDNELASETESFTSPCADNSTLSVRRVFLNNQRLATPVIKQITPGKTYQVRVELSR